MNLLNIFRTKPKLRIYYTSFIRRKCPFCGEVAETHVESKTCGGYFAHVSCMDEVRRWQDETGILVVTLGDGQKVSDLVEVNNYEIESVVDILARSSKV